MALSADVGCLWGPPTNDTSGSALEDVILVVPVPLSARGAADSSFLHDSAVVAPPKKVRNLLASDRTLKSSVAVLSHATQRPSHACRML